MSHELKSTRTAKTATTSLDSPIILILEIRNSENNWKVLKTKMWKKWAMKNKFTKNFKLTWKGSR